MYVTNQKISNRQTFRLFVFDLMGIATLLLPPYLSKLCGMDGLIAIGIGTVLGFLYLFYVGWIMKKMKTDMVSFLKNNTNAFVEILVYLWVMMHSIFTAGFCAYVFGNLMQYSLVKEVSTTTVLFVIVVVAAYAVSGGIESRARVYEVLFWIILIPYIAMMLASAKDFNPVYIEGFLESSGADLFKGTYLVFLFVTPLFFSLFLIREKVKSNERNVVKTITLALMVSAIILFGSYVLLIGNFGKNALAAMKYPVVTIMSTVQFRGNFLKRMDALMLAVWFFTLYALLNLHLHYAVNMFGELWQKCRQTTKNRGEKILRVGIPSGIVFFVAYTISSNSDWLWRFIDYYSYVAVPIMVAGPLFIFLLGRKKNEK